MIERARFDSWITAADLASDEKFNEAEASIRTIQLMLNDAGLYAYKPFSIPVISEENKCKRVEFCQKVSRWNKNWERVVFTDESWICAEPFHLRYVRRAYGE